VRPGRGANELDGRRERTRDQAQTNSTAGANELRSRRQTNPTIPPCPSWGGHGVMTSSFDLKGLWKRTPSTLLEKLRRRTNPPAGAERTHDRHERTRRRAPNELRAWRRTNLTFPMFRRARAPPGDGLQHPAHGQAVSPVGVGPVAAGEPPGQVIPLDPAVAAEDLDDGQGHHGVVGVGGGEPPTAARAVPGRPRPFRWRTGRDRRVSSWAQRFGVRSLPCLRMRGMMTPRAWTGRPAGRFAGRPPCGMGRGAGKRCRR
jgi:hypothetical protein